MDIAIGNIHGRSMEYLIGLKLCPLVSGQDFISGGGICSLDHAVLHALTALGRQGGEFALCRNLILINAARLNSAKALAMKHAPSKALLAGTLYFALIFALGFVLGTLRVLWLMPLVGQTLAVLAEQPVMLTASWFAARWLLRRYGFQSVRDRAVMGGIALVLLFIAEIALGFTLFNQSLTRSLTEALVLPGLIGLIGQIIFGLMPLLVRATR